nr:leucine-rich repeat-containing G-protein coupled receptor 4-like [Procambarus clarkii]
MSAIMLREFVTFLACIIGIAMCYTNPPKCPAECECEGPTITCDSELGPSLDPRFTSFKIQDASHAITTLSPAITTKLKNLVELQLVTVRLTEIEPGALGIIERLENLKIANNNIHKIGIETFKNCSSLIYLNLENNNINVIEDGTFASMSDLRNLSIAHNDIIALPKHLPANLQALNTEYNQITKIQDLSLSSLISLNLCYNSISNIDPDQIDVKNVKELCLGGTVFKLSDNLISHDTFPILESLQLKGTTQNPVYIKEIFQRDIQIMAEISLHTLELKSCSLLSARFFNQMKSKLHSLKVTDTTLTLRDLRMPKFTLPSITIFDLSGSPNLARLFLTSLAPTTLPELKILRMSHCNIKIFPESFLQYKTPNVNQVDLSHNPLECTCYGLSWIPKYVRQQKLILLHEENTTCGSPQHLKDIPLLTATLCPITINTDESTSSTVYLGTSSNKTGVSMDHQQWDLSANQTDSTIGTSRNEPQSHLPVIISGIVGAAVLVIILIMLMRPILSCYRNGFFLVEDNSSNKGTDRVTVVYMSKS